MISLIVGVGRERRVLGGGAGDHMITCPGDEGQIEERWDRLRLGWSNEDLRIVKTLSKLVCGR